MRADDESFNYNYLSQEGVLRGLAPDSDFSLQYDIWSTRQGRLSKRCSKVNVA